MASVLRPNRAVDCWIGIAQEGDRRVVRVAGRLSVDQVPELLKACEAGGPVELDLTELVSADAMGIEVLQQIRRTGVSLVGLPGYLQLKIDSPDGRPISALPPKRARPG